MELRGKTVMVTGGAKRIGKSIALAFAEKGCDVVLHYNRSSREAEGTRGEIEKLGVKCSLVQCDLTDASSLDKMLEENKEIPSRVSILINCASLFQETPLETLSKKDSEKLFAVHYEAPLKLAKTIGLRLKKENQEGAIINITDAMLRYPYPHHDAYFASKGALATLTKALVLELAPTVRINAVAPGCILFPEDYPEEKKTGILKAIPLKRQGTPEEIASACIFLAEMDYINGVTLTVDGGRTL